MTDRDVRSRGLGLVLLGGAGLVASFAVTVDKLRIVADPTFTPGCDLNRCSRAGR